MLKRKRPIINMKLITLIIVLLLSLAAKPQEKDIRQIRHQLNTSLIKRGKTNADSALTLNDSKLVADYLGKVKTSSGKTFYILKNYYVFNIKRSPTINSHIFLYDGSHRFVGYYYLPLKSYLPYSLSENKLYFQLSEEKCNEKSVADFSAGIPEFINIKCDGNNMIEFIKCSR